MLLPEVITLAVLYRGATNGSEVMALVARLISWELGNGDVDAISSAPKRRPAACSVISLGCERIDIRPRINSLDSLPAARAGIRLTPRGPRTSGAMFPAISVATST